MSIQGKVIEVTVIGCSNLKDTEWISRQDPYVNISYGTTKYRTKTCTDGGKNPTFQEKFVFPLFEGLREMEVIVFNENTITSDDFVGSGKVQLHKCLTQGFDDTAWPLTTKSGKSAGSVRMILHYSIAHTPGGAVAPPPPGGYAQPAAHYAPPPAAYQQPPPPAAGYSGYSQPGYGAAPTGYPAGGHVYPPAPTQDYYHGNQNPYW